MLDLRTEKLLTLAQAAALVPSRRGRTVSPSTLRHWCRVGCAGRVLQHVRRPSGDYLTCEKWLMEFLTGVRDGMERPQPPETGDEALRKERLRAMGW